MLEALDELTTDRLSFENLEIAGRVQQGEPTIFTDENGRHLSVGGKFCIKPVTKWGNALLEIVIERLEQRSLTLQRNSHMLSEWYEMVLQERKRRQMKDREKRVRESIRYHGHEGWLAEHCSQILLMLAVFMVVVFCAFGVHELMRVIKPVGASVAPTQWLDKPIHEGNTLWTPMQKELRIEYVVFHQIRLRSGFTDAINYSINCSAQTIQASVQVPDWLIQLEKGIEKMEEEMNAAASVSSTTALLTTRRALTTQTPENSPKAVRRKRRAIEETYWLPSIN